MKINLRLSLAALVAVLLLPCCANAPEVNPAADGSAPNLTKEASATLERSSMDSALPVWAEGRESEYNLDLAFRATVRSNGRQRAKVRLTAQNSYRLKVNGEFVAHGPCVAAHDWFRIDEYDITAHLKKGENVVAIEVVAYNDPGYSFANGSGFLAAEVILQHRVIAATGAVSGKRGKRIVPFRAYELKNKRQDVPRYSLQRPALEVYDITSDYDKWCSDPSWDAPDKEVALAVQPDKQYLPRHVLQPKFDIVEAEALSDTMFHFQGNKCGFLGAVVKVSEPTELTLAFEELLYPTPDRKFRELWKNQSKAVFNLQPGEYPIETMEPYAMQYVDCIADRPGVEVEKVYIREYVGSDANRAQFECSDPKVNALFEAARETHRQNALDIFIDCPHRERGGWLGDSYFSARAAMVFSGRTRVEDNFFQNFLIRDTFPNAPQGMIPMLYPGDDLFGPSYIPNWAMWFILELEEYATRRGHPEVLEAARSKVYSLCEFFEQYLNEYGLLENLSSWVFVEWSHANDLVQDVNFPTNMLYAEMLDAIGRMYHDSDLTDQAAILRHTIREWSYNGEFFEDNAVRDDKGILKSTGECTEVCQYYAFFSNTAAPETHPELWKKIVEEFTPDRTARGAYPEIWPANVWPGCFLRYEILSRRGLSKQLLDEIVATFYPMTLMTTTLWENLDISASCDHGFGATLAFIFFRDILGVRDIDLEERKVLISMKDFGLEWCRGSIPVGGENIEFQWKLKPDGYFDYTISVPEGFIFEEL